MRLAANPALSPDGATLAFDWRGEIWTVSSGGGVARQLTQHTADDLEPEFSPDGSQIAFISQRTGSRQLFLIAPDGGPPQQLTSHTGGFTLEGWYPDGQSLLASGQRDHFWRDADRFFRVRRQPGAAEELLFDDYGESASISPDGNRLLFVREGAPWWRKGYHGSQAGQVWMYDQDTKVFTRLLASDRAALWPMWKPDGKGFYYVGDQTGTFNLYEYSLESKVDRQITKFEDDGVVFPCLSRDGSTLVFRRLFDLYRIKLNADETPAKIEIFQAGDQLAEPTQRRTLSQATDVAFSADGLEIAIIAGGDLWVMDTELREPKQITSTPEEERNPVFSPDGNEIWFISDAEGQADIWKAVRNDPKLYWWQSSKFTLTRLTQDAEVESNMTFSPDGERVAFVRGAGDLWTLNKQGQEPKRILQSWDAPQYDWSPDGKWLVYAQQDSDFNQDIWIAPLDGSRPPFNLSRHPDNEFAPVWSPDGKMIAFSGRRVGEEVDIYFVHLRAEDAEKGSRDTTLEKALDKINKARRRGSATTRPGTTGTSGASGGPASAPATEAPKPKVEVVIDWDELHDRIKQISIPNSTESSLFWSHDSKKLAFSATVGSQRGTYTVEIGESLTPKLLAAQTGNRARWISQGDQILWLSNGVPASLAAAMGRASEYRFQALQEVNLVQKNRAVFDLCWRQMRDRYYDERLGNKNWNEIRRKYIDMAGEAQDESALVTVVQLMLGELNGSHLGFIPMRFGGGPGGPPTTPPGTPATPAPQTERERGWSIVTPHLGLRFDTAHKGPGLLVKDVIPNGPTDQKKSRVEAGETVLAIDGTSVDPGMDLAKVLNGPGARDITLQVKNAKGEERSVIVRPISYTAVRELLYEKWVRDNRAMVDKLSEGKLGYLHIRGMNMPSFNRFEEELYSVGAGKQGLVIDVRENGGGSTTDHLLTILTQPVHAITVPRGGTPGYPHDRKVYATWNKPIVVLCNQNSFSNAEIFSHAIKTLGRGQLVGVPTAGGVISTSGTTIMDVGFLRLPTRGWYLLNDGEDMELNGAVPHHIIWPEPGQRAAGKDLQVEKAIEVLLADVKKWNERPQPQLRKATQR